jgi:arabinofuranan 3-O-arabinosyltransferase
VRVRWAVDHGDVDHARIAYQDPPDPYSESPGAKWAARGVTVGLWVAAAVSWGLLYRSILVEKKLGWDLLTAWRAENAFAHGGAPYAVKAFVYPPSCLIVLRPLAGLNAHQLTVGGLVCVTVLAWLSVMVAATAIGLKWWGPVTAGCVLLLSLVSDMRGEMPLENVSILMFLAIALFFLFVFRNHWIAAAVVIGLSISIKPLLLAVLIVFLIGRKWRAFAVAVAIPFVLNAVGISLVSDPRQVLSKLPALFDRSGSGVAYNSAWVDVGRELGIPDALTIVLRVMTVLLVIAASWLAWNRLKDQRLRIITVTSVLLIGVFLAGTLSEYHFMLVLVPLFMSVMIAGSPIRSIPGVIGMCWIMDVFGPPSAIFGLSDNARDSAFRAIGMGVVLITIIVSIVRRPSNQLDSDSERESRVRPSVEPHTSELVGASS